MVCIRYEFSDTGIFSALDLLETAPMTDEDEKTYDFIMQQFADDLDEPPILKTMTGRTGVSLFTEKGNEAFSCEMKELENLYNEYLTSAGLGVFNIIELDVPENEILYRDEYQVVIHRDVYERLLVEQYPNPYQNFEDDEVR